MRPLKALILAILVLAATAGVARAGAQDFMLQNTTGFDIHALYIAPSASEDWGEEMLGGSVLPHGNEVMINFTGAGGTKLWDIWVEDADGNALYWREIDLVQASTVTLKPKGIASIE